MRSLVALVPSLTLGACLVAGLAACDARPSPASDALGLAPVPRWQQQDCAPDVQTTFLGVPSSQFWHCRLPQHAATATVDWWRGTAIAGERRWPHLDRARWERFQDSVATVLAAHARPRTCAKPLPEETYPPGFTSRMRLWSVDAKRPADRRWIALDAMYSSWASEGYVVVRTGPGDADPCAAQFRRQNIIGQ